MMVAVEENEYARLLGYPWGTVLDGDVRERAALAAAWYTRNGNPQVYCVVIDQWTDSAVVAITAGSTVDCETDRLWREDRPDEAYFLDRYAAAVVEILPGDLDLTEPGNGRYSIRAAVGTVLSYRAVET